MEMIPDDFYFLGNDSRWLLLSISFFIDLICFWSKPGAFLQETVKPFTGFMRSIRSRRFPKKPKAIFGNNSRWLLLSMSFFIDLIYFKSRPGVFLQETVKPFTGFMRSIRSRRFPKKPKAIFGNNSRWLLLSMSFFIDLICFWSRPGVFLQETVKPFTGFMRSRRFPKKSKAIFSEIIPDGFYFQCLFSSMSFASGQGRGYSCRKP